jgi:DNA-binding transcriptional ArsR family regulator
MSSGVASPAPGPEETVAALRATAHPVRLRILSLLTGAAMSAAEVARELELTHANASYHLRQLLRADLLVVAEETSIRGGRAKRYRHDPARAPQTGPDDGERQAIWRAAAEELLRRVPQQARPSAARQLMTDAELWVAPEVWAEVVTRSYQDSLRLHEAAQPPRTPGTIRVSATVALFEMTSPASSELPAGPEASDAGDGGAR